MKTNSLALSFLLLLASSTTAHGFGTGHHPSLVARRQQQQQQQRQHESALHAIDPQSAVEWMNHASTTVLALKSIVHSAATSVSHSASAPTYPSIEEVDTMLQSASSLVSHHREPLQKAASLSNDVTTVLSTTKLFQKCGRRLSDVFSGHKAALLVENTVLSLGEDYALHDDIDWQNHIGLALRVGMTAVFAYKKLQREQQKKNNRRRSSGNICTPLAALSEVVNLL